MNIAYFGSPELSSKLLEMILTHRDLNVCLVVTQSDKPKGKRLTTEACHVKRIAVDNNIPVFDNPLKNNVSELLTLFELYKIDIAILFAYGAIIPNIVLVKPKYGFLNVHPSLLPKYRGASPTIFPFLLGDHKIGVTLMQMDPQLDEGPIINKEILKTSNVPTRQEFENKIPEIAFKQITKIINEISNGSLQSINQDHKLSTYTRTIKKDDGFIETSLINKALNGASVNTIDELPKIIKWYFVRNKLSIKGLPSRQASFIINNMVKTLCPWPGVWTIFKTNKNEFKRLKIIDCDISESILKINFVQIEGKNKIRYSDFVKSYSF